MPPTARYSTARMFKLQWELWKIMCFSQLAVVPNPVSDDAQIVFSLDKASEIQIDVLDVLGKIIETPMKGIRPQGLQRVSRTAAG